MKKADIDWNVLWTPLLIFSVVMLFSITLIISSHLYMEHVNDQFERNNSQFRNISSKYLKVDEEEKLIQNFYPHFVKLYNDGLLGKERRLDWIEAIQTVSENLEIPTLRYEIASQEIRPNNMGINTGKFQIYQSPMTFKMDMLHELDLIRFIDRIDRLARGYFTVSRCTIVRKNKTIENDELTSNLSAECKINWLNIKMSNGEDITL